MKEKVDWMGESSYSSLGGILYGYSILPRLSASGTRTGLMNFAATAWKKTQLYVAYKIAGSRSQYPDKSNII